MGWGEGEGLGEWESKRKGAGTHKRERARQRGRSERGARLVDEPEVMGDEEQPALKLFDALRQRVDGLLQHHTARQFRLKSHDSSHVSSG